VFKSYTFGVFCFILKMQTIFCSTLTNDLVSSMVAILMICLYSGDLMYYTKNSEITCIGHGTYQKTPTNLMFIDPCIIVQFIMKQPTRCNRVSKFIISCLYKAQHVSGDTPAHHQEHNCTSSLWFCICERLLNVVVAVDSIQQPQHPTTFHVRKTRGC